MNCKNFLHKNKSNVELKRMSKSKKIVCDCKDKGLAIKVYGTSSWLCVHTHLLGVYPLIVNFWSKNNKIEPQNILKGSDKKVLLNCGNCGVENEKAAVGIKNNAFKCNSCKKMNKLVNEELCICKQQTTAKTFRNWVCEHDNLLIACPNVNEFWDDKNEKSPIKFAKDQ